MSRVVLLFMLCVCVAADGRTVQVNVNRVLLTSVENSSAAFVASTKYFYVTGDAVDVWCLRWVATCDLKLTYQFDDKQIGGNGTIFDYWEGADSLVGVRTTLGAAHEGKLVICECARGQVNYTIKVQFVQIESDGILELKINSVFIRYQQQPAAAADGVYNVYYSHKQNTHFSVDCNTIYKKDFVVEYLNNDQSIAREKKIIFTGDIFFRCVAKSNDTHRRIWRDLRIYFVNDGVIDSEMYLTVNTSNTVMELYKPRIHRRILYDFDDGETLTVNCSTSLHNTNLSLYTLIFFDAATKQNSIVRQFQLSSSYDKKQVSCYLVISPSYIRKHVTIIFRLKTPIRSTSAPHLDTPARMPPRVKISEGPLMEVQHGAMVTLTCTVLAYPGPFRFGWTGPRGATVSHPVLVRSSTERVVKLTILYVSTQTDYTCHVETSEGSSFDTIQLVVKEQADAGSTLYDDGGFSPTKESSHIAEIIASAVSLTGLLLTAVAVFYCIRRRRNGSTEAFEMSAASARSRPLPSVPRAPTVAYDHARPAQTALEYCEIADVRPQASDDHQQRVAEEHGVQNTMYYWI